MDLRMVLWRRSLLGREIRELRLIAVKGNSIVFRV
jgi:hypothetical protein